MSPVPAPAALGRPVFRALPLLAAAALLASVAAAAAPRQEGPPPAPRPIHAVPRVSGEITVDGRVEEPAWGAALVLSLDFETRPGENVPPPVDTEVLITYDSAHLYVGFRAHDTAPEKIRAHLSDRDTAWDDDFVGVVIDTFNDERRAFEFFVNPLGVQMDLFLDDLGGNESAAWDAIWDSAGRITEGGYEVELAIPFHQLRFPRAQGPQVWGFDALRFVPRGQRHRIAMQPLDRAVDCYLCQVSKMRGFEGASPGRNLEIVPTLTASRTGEREEFPDGRLEDGDVDSDPGLTVRWGMTPNLTLSGTLNPDFSQVEADVAQLDVNEQFALFFPERRPFFLEGEDVFRTPLRVVFTRNVADPDWGIKLTGKEGKHAIGVFAARDRITNLLFPGAQSSEADSFAFETTDAVLRYRRDFGRSSALGVLLTDRSGDGYSNSVAGIDGLYRVSDADSFSFQALTSRTEYPADVAADFAQPAGAFDDRAFRVAYQHDSREWDVWARWEDVGGGFRADLGFLPQVDTSLWLAGASRTWWGDEDDWYTQWRVGGDWDRREDGSGRLLEEEIELWTEFGGPKQSWLWVDVGTRDRSFEGVPFDDQAFVNLWAEIQPNGSFWFGLSGHAGEGIDFANVREADVVEVSPEMRWNLGKHVRTTFAHAYRRLDVDGGTLFEADLSQLRVVYQINVRTFVRAIFQYRTVERDLALYDDPEDLEPESESLFSQLLFSYKINPQTVLFVGFSDDREGSQDVDLTQRGRTAFFKVGYAWNL